MTDISTQDRQAQAIRDRAPMQIRQPWEQGEVDTAEAYRQLTEWDTLEELKRRKRLEYDAEF